MQLVAIEAQTRCGGGENAGTDSFMVKPKCDGSTSRTVFHWQFEAVTDYSSWAAQEKATHLLDILLGHTANILHSVPAGATYKDIIRFWRAITETTNWQQPTNDNSEPGPSWAAIH
jgi:hypothetical protein